MDKNIGRRLDGRYEILELIGVGGMADIYKANDIIEDKIVAVKILRNDLAEDDDFLRRFRNESKAIALLSHPNIVKIFDVGFSDKIQFLVMEFIDGITLTEFIEQQGVLKWKDAIHFTIQILRALQHAHDRGIVHRDIKPQNIMLLQDGTIKVMDFGIARFAREEGKTVSDKTIGSVHYISPEQARGDITDEKSDLYAVGVMLFEMLTGEKPFVGENPVAIALMHMQSNAKSPTEINSTIPEGLEEIVQRAMQKDSTKRYQSAAEMIKDIEEFKKNPSIVFEYKYLNQDETTKYFDIANPAANNADGDDEDDEEYEYEEAKSPLVPILAAIATAFVLIASIVIFISVTKGFGSSKGEDIEMPNLVGLDFLEARTLHTDINIEEELQEYSDYEKGQIFEQDIHEGRMVKKGQTVKVKVSKGTKMVTIPPVNGLEAEEAMSILLEAGLQPVQRMRFSEHTKGFVFDVVPEVGETVESGTEVEVYISQGIEEVDKPVPNLIGMTEKKAKSELDELSLIVKVETVDSAEKKGEVVGQDPPKGTVLKSGDVVTIEVSNGKPPKNDLTINVPIPKGNKGSFVFIAYVDGVEMKTATVNVEITDKWKVELSGSGKAKVFIRVNIEGGEKDDAKKYAEYDVDFNAGTSKETTRNGKVFEEIIEENRAPDAPTSLKQTGEKDGFITITWKGVTGSDIDYFIYVDGEKIKDPTRDTKYLLVKENLFKNKDTVTITVTAKNKS
ncbi:MAG: Stk1 family PASTA domain-containing Ser/Thr kinase, partial [Clostridiales bacterium]|nr:Stk1 family PASTA domain-containing Ser/Thr kinase [Clostridiales bacterium]